MHTHTHAHAHTCTHTHAYTHMHIQDEYQSQLTRAQELQQQLLAGGVEVSAKTVGLGLKGTDLGRVIAALTFHSDRLPLPFETETRRRGRREIVDQKLR